MTPEQRAEALRLANNLDYVFAKWHDDIYAAAALLRSLAAEPERKPLTDVALRDIMRLHDNLTLRSHWPAIKSIMQDVERAHGIGD